MTYTLEIEVIDRDNHELINYYDRLDDNRRKEDSGIDLLILRIETRRINEIMHGIRCRMLKQVGGKMIRVPYWLIPRSSISETPFRMSNSIGLIDRGYRGEIIARVDYFAELEITDGWSGDSLFQIAAPDLGEIAEVRRVESIDDITERGEDRFGSTN